MSDYHPKGSMCAACEHVINDCSKLEFHRMPVLSKYKYGGQKRFVVRCTAFKHRLTKQADGVS